MEIYNSRNNVIDEAGHPKLHDLVDDIWNGIIKKEKHRIKHCTDYNIDDEDSSEVLDDDDDDPGSRSNQMKTNLRISFKSDHPTEFEIGFDYRVPFKVKKGQPKQLDYVRQLLQEYKAYQFLDKNYLGYVFAEICGIEEDRHKLPIHFLKSTDPKINGTENSQDIVFMAIEVTPEVKKAIIKRAFNGATKLANLSEELHTVTIDGKEYQIIGVATVQNDKNTDPALISTFQDFINGINNELNPEIEKARKKGQAFVLSKKYHTIISQINTGRLEKTNDAEDVGDTKVSLYDFMTSSQGKSDRRTSTEWSTGGDFYFGVVLNGVFRIIAGNNTEAERISDPNESGLIINSPNDRWMERNNGALVLLIPKPDGQLYPVRVTRRTVGDFLEKVADGVHTGRELLELADHNPKENEYLSEILQNLRILLDDDKSMKARIQAKMQLSKFFIFGKKTSAISINRDGVTLKFGDEKYTLSGSTIEEQIKDFFDTLAYHRIKFTLPKSFVGTGITGRDVITSGAFEIGLKNFYNFNANFTVLPVNGKGEMVSVKEPETLPNTGEHQRGAFLDLDFGDGRKTYSIDENGKAFVDGKPVTKKIQNVINLIIKAKNGQLKSYPEYLINQLYADNPAVLSYVLPCIKDIKDKIFIFESDGQLYIYDQRQKQENFPYRLNSKKGNDLKKELNQIISTFVEGHLTDIMKLKESSGKGQEEGHKNEGNGDNGTEQKLPEGFNIGDKVQNKNGATGTIIGVATKEESNPGYIKVQWEDGSIGTFSPKLDLDVLKEMKEKAQKKKPQLPSPVGSGGSVSTKRFSGKTLEELQESEDPFIHYLGINTKCVSRQEVLAALQFAEESGIPIDDNMVWRELDAVVLETDLQKKIRLRDELISKIKHCNH